MTVTEITRKQLTARLPEKPMKKFMIFALGASLLALSFPTWAQQPTKIFRVGYVSSSGSPGNPGPQIDAFQRALGDLGYVEGKNILIEYRHIEGKRDLVPSLVAGLLQLKVDVLVTTTPTSSRVAKRATQSIPIVFVITQDPVVTGLVESLARPGGNITGLTQLTRELSGKRLELLKEVVPTISRVGVLTVADPAARGNALKEYQAAARALKIPMVSLPVRRTNLDIDGAFREAVKERVSALISARNNVLGPYTRKIADLAIKNRLPSMHEVSRHVEDGGLMSYGADDAEIFRRAAVYVDKILKGTKPADLPVEQPTKFELVINLKTAKQIGLNIPQSVLFRADKVIK